MMDTTSRKAIEMLEEFTESTKKATAALREFGTIYRKQRRKRREERQKLAAWKGPARREKRPKRARYYRKTGLPKRERSKIRGRAKRAAGLNRRGLPIVRRVKLLEDSEWLRVM
jgi:hypothetical protein